MTPEEAFVLGYRECLLRVQKCARVLDLLKDQTAWEAKRRAKRGLLSREDADALLKGETYEPDN